jgi:hypothetical protein
MELPGEAVQALARTAFPTASVSVIPDLAGRERVMEIRLFSKNLVTPI